jgi:hypothetical protein
MTFDPVSDHERLEELIRRVQRLERDMDELRKVCAESRATSTARRSSATSAVRGPYSCHVILRIPNPLAPLFLRPRGGEPLRGHRTRPVLRSGSRLDGSSGPAGKACVRMSRNPRSPRPSEPKTAATIRYLLHLVRVQ